MSEIPKTQNGKNNWVASKGKCIKGVYKGIPYEFYITNYNKETHILTFADVNKNEYEKNVQTITNNSFGFEVGYFNHGFKYKVGDCISNNKNNRIVLKRYYKQGNNGRVKVYDLECLNCKYIAIGVREDNLKRNGCPCCCNPPKVIVDGINNIPTLAPWMISYFKGGYDEAKLYAPQSNQKIKPMCPECGTELNKFVYINNVYRQHSTGCICGDGFSYPEKIMHFILKKLGVEFIYHYSPKWAYGREYDFYIPKLSLIIEMDGGIGHGNKVFPNAKITIEDSIEIDNYKDDLARGKELLVVRINCTPSEFNHIKENILHSSLPSVIGFTENDIDWRECNINAMSSLLKKVCDYYESNENLSTKDVATHFNLSRKTVIDYLNKGKNIGICKYNWQERNDKRRSHQIKSSVNKVLQFDLNRNLLHIYNSAIEAEELTGIRAIDIRAVCRKDKGRKTAGGYIWEYVY